MSLEDEFGDWLFPVTVETYSGSGAWGESWNPPQTAEVWHQPKVQNVITADGKTVTSGSFLVAKSADLAKFAINSKVTINGVTARVITSATFPGDDSHVEVYLT